MYITPYTRVYHSRVSVKNWGMARFIILIWSKRSKLWSRFFLSLDITSENKMVSVIDCRLIICIISPIYI
jgi:hypothetical protein